MSLYAKDDASGFFYEHTEKRHSYSYVLPCAVANENVGHVRRIVFCFYLKSFKNRFFSRLDY